MSSWKLEKKKTYLIAMACPLPPRSAPLPPPAHIYVRAWVYKLRRLFELENLSPHPMQGSVTFDGPPPPPTPGCEKPAGVLKIRTGSLKIDSVGVLFRKIPAFPRTCYTPSPSPPPVVVGLGGMKRGVYSLSLLKGRLHRFEQF